MSSTAAEWPTAVLRSLEAIHKIYGKVVSTSYPSNIDPNLRIEFKINPCLDLTIDEPVIIEFEVDSSFPTNLPKVVVRDISQFEPKDGISFEGNRLIINWMEKAKYPLSVWVYAVRSLLQNPRHLPWDTPPTLQAHFALNDGQPTISPPSLFGGTGRIRGKRMYMEDVDFFHTISPLGRSITIYGVLDGHGGQECARYASEEIPSHIISSLRAGSSLMESLYHSFLKTDSHFIKSNTSQLKAGSTSTVMLFDHHTGLTCMANSGDTRAVLSRLRTAIDLTRDMKSSNPMEIARILSSGGYIVNGRVLGSLAVSRALGDCQLKDINDKAVIADPEITSFYFQSDDEFIVIATDGLWDVMPSQTVIDMVWAALTEQQLYPLPPSPDEALIAAALGKIGESLANHACNNLNSADNITVTIILLRHSNGPPPQSSNRLYRPALEVPPTEEKISGDYSSRSVQAGRPLGGREATSSGGVGSVAAEKRKIESGVSDDDLMRFLMDDSNF